MGYGSLTKEIFEELASAVGRGAAVMDADALENYAYDQAGRVWGHMPEAVVRPRNTEQVSSVMKIASKYRIPVTPRGAGSGLNGGAVPLAGGVVLSLERMNKILEIDKINRVAVVEPGVVTNDLCRAAAAEGFLYAGYPMSTETSFIGGNFATNAGGGKVIRYGSTRRHVLGAEVVLASGEIMHLGGRFRKDTWGYSLLNLLAGSEGTLAIATKLIVNLEPKPGKVVNLLSCYPDVEKLVESVAKVIGSGCRIISCEFMDRNLVRYTTEYLGCTLPEQERSEGYLLIQIEGDTDEQLEEGYETVGKICLEGGAFEVFVAENRTDSAAMWNVRQNGLEGMRARDPYACASGDLMVPLSAVPEMLRRIKRISGEWNVEIGIISHIGDGNLHPIPLKPEGMTPERWASYAEEFFSVLINEAISLGGVGCGEHGVGHVKQMVLTENKTPAELEIMRGIKKAFDPQNILNPGKMFFKLQ
ncbi:MAG: FAD-linked oxidase C-terminal domain-containing protein [Synergistes jonesii]|uniref:FAD-binding oxidoreductase n=1 Tax=Synergistes jonesii TaxID=2754 RepID=UPI002A7537CA|nr:FAD-linked oxidase C-terminal domain-containing protein [Synergistes jonesii]MDY2985552.1 FAD-linked oxidase C-terminal domain-containing protein [Synergistes jonesii]